ncbi:MAG: VCP-like ATPase [Candidatus Heimdallarchaeota archaeon LC_3]|nr:MAG: VCP-like ATPase [Candidatus Heimdallarchaeota archaeon LC_3]
MPIQVLIEKAYPFDIGLGLVRKPLNLANDLDLKEGDILKICGERNTYATLKFDTNSEPSSIDRKEIIQTIKIDLNTKMNAKISTDNYGLVEKAQAFNAAVMSLAPIEIPQKIPYLTAFIQSNLIKRVFCKGDIVDFDILGKKVPFIVSYISPVEHEAIIITPESEIRIRDNPLNDVDIEHLPRVSFDDIGGLHEAKRLIIENIQLPFLYPEIYQQLRISPPRGILIHGPHGSGKTVLDKAIASIIDAHFISIIGPEIVGTHLGQAPKKLKEIFNEASKKAPSIIFIDELDPLAPKREDLIYDTVMKNTVSELVSLMDGLSVHNNVVVVGATTDPDVLDSALRRTGRFDKEIKLNIPTKEERLEILQILTRKLSKDETVYLLELSESTHGYSGGDLSALCREAAMHTLRRLDSNLLSPEARRIPLNNLKALKISQNDFKAALSTTKPSMLRYLTIEVPKQNWNDIGGLEGVKQLLQEAIEWPLKYGEICKYMRAKSPKGVLFFGNHGTGKTTLTRNVASECEANFISIKGPELLNKWLGKSEEAVREIFNKARQSSPCVLFFDEIDAIAPVRERNDTNVHAERVVSQILAEMDGLQSLKDVFVIGATNRPELVDPALLRPGRLGILIHIPLPNVKTRELILRIHTRDKPLDSEIVLADSAEKMANFTGADIEEVTNRAATLGIKQKITEAGGEKSFIEMIKSKDFRNFKINLSHFEDALLEIAPSGSSDEEDHYQELIQRKLSQLPMKETPRLYL